jgi:capsular polysaccharide biosynthesis protein
MIKEPDMDNKNEDIEIDLIDLFYLIRARLWIILLTGILTASIAGLLSSFMLTPLYTSKSQLYILTKTTSLTSLADIQMGTTLTQDYMVMVKSRTVVNQVIKNLDLDMEYDQLVNVITVSNPSNTRILQISAEYPDSYMAKKIADEFATVSKTRIAQIMDTDEPTIIDLGYASPSPSSPRTTRNIAIGAIIGIFLSAGVIIVLHLLDDTIKSSEDIEKYLGISTLGLIPIEAGAAKQAVLDKKKRKKQMSRSNSRKG